MGLDFNLTSKQLVLVIVFKAAGDQTIAQNYWPRKLNLLTFKRLFPLGLCLWFRLCDFNSNRLNGIHWGQTFLVSKAWPESWIPFEVLWISPPERGQLEWPSSQTLPEHEIVLVCSEKTELRPQALHCSQTVNGHELWKGSERKSLSYMDKI